MKKERLQHCRLVVWPWKKVPRGTNGGVSLIGLFAALAGALLVAFSSSLTLYLTGGLSGTDSAADKKNLYSLLVSLTLTGKLRQNSYFLALKIMKKIDQVCRDLPILYNRNPIGFLDYV